MKDKHKWYIFRLDQTEAPPEEDTFTNYGDARDYAQACHLTRKTPKRHGRQLYELTTHGHPDGYRTHTSYIATLSGMRAHGFELADVIEKHK